MMSTRNKDTKGFLLGALAGGVIGSVAALLFAPKTGKALRQDISAGAQKVGDTTLYAANKVGETTTRIAKEIGDRTTTIAGSIVDSVKGIRRGSDTDGVLTISGTAAGQGDEWSEESLEAAIAAQTDDSAKQLS
ncbi:YtxH domain-containing protein [Paenibacillus sp. PL2-23]|uniref:YtxH domain-containing protein n=1 Tax=Paenibacillus sp. PL2-23 TaxID=2100729 RepID=UPI0030F524FE